MSSSLEIKQEGSEMVIRISMDKIVGDFLSQEEQVQELLNRVGCEMVKGLLKSYDTDGGSIEVEGKVYTSKGCEKKSMRLYLGKYPCIGKFISLLRVVLPTFPWMLISVFMVVAVRCCVRLWGLNIVMGVVSRLPKIWH